MFGLGLVLGLRLAGLVLGWSLILGSRLVNWFDLVPGLRLAWFRWFGVGSWAETGWVGSWLELDSWFQIG